MDFENNWITQIYSSIATSLQYSILSLCFLGLKYSDRYLCPYAHAATLDEQRNASSIGHRNRNSDDVFLLLFYVHSLYIGSFFAHPLSLFGSLVSVGFSDMKTSFSTFSWEGIATVVGAFYSFAKPKVDY